tara:strand:+ start:13818 stop:15104 length:1287 start_codon:yes stop_codon:yes gene_type:complete
MNLKEVSQYCVKKLNELGADESQVYTSQNYFDELVYENDRFTLMRSVDDYSIDLQVIKDEKEGRYNINKLDKEELDIACTKVLEIASGGKKDSAFAIAPASAKCSKVHGEKEANREGMYHMIDTFIKEATTKYPIIGLRSATCKFYKSKVSMQNSNGAENEIEKSHYNFGTLFNAQEGDKSSSMNYDSFDFNTFEKSAFEQSSLDRSLSETTMHLNTKKIGKTFSGKAIISPQCINGFIQMMLGHLGTGKLISKTSRLQDRIGEKVASKLFNLKSMPQDKVFANPNFLTSDGIETKNIDIFNEGVLQNYLLGLYGKNKLEASEVTNFASRLYMPKGEKSLEEMITEIDEGILIGRFSGGQPNANGDLSGIAKNSFYIKDGKIAFALSETMISGNLFSFFESMWGSSSDIYNNGTCHLPYVGVDDVTIS